MLYDKEFLKQLDKSRTKTKYARITTLTWDEMPIQQVEGRITQGSINLDGSSAVRRTCSLTMVVDDVDVSNYYWGLNTKFKLDIGIKNNVDKNYPDIIWFPQGLYLITNFSSSLGVNNFTLSLQGKDKMCLLNGDLGGLITAQTQFDSWEEESEDGLWAIRKYPIKQIIRDAVHQYGGEPFYNIVINDLDEMGLELLEYRYDTPMFLIREANNSDYIQGTLNSETEFWVKDNLGNMVLTTIGKIDENGNSIYSYDLLVDDFAQASNPTIFYDSEGKEFCVAKISYGETAGYRATDLVYPSELIGNVGESLVSVLDKIKNVLGEFEYFYDLDGRFVFQRKRNYIDTVWSPIGEDGYVKDMSQHTMETYVFSGNELITSFNNQPNLNNIKNDFSVWGSRKSSSGTDIPIHMRYAIDEKPIYYKTIGEIKINENGDDEFVNQTIYYTDEIQSEIENAYRVDWRELIYQMALDYDKYNRHEQFELQIIRNNPPISDFNFAGYITGRTGYEIYYIDLQGFWRQLYYPAYAYEAQMEKYNIQLKNLQLELDKTTANTEENQYIKNTIASLEVEIEDFEENYNANFYKGSGEVNEIKKYWNRLVYDKPEQLNFWFDFLDLDGDLNKYSCRAIGARPKAVNDTAVKSIYFRSTPTIIFYEHELQKSTHTGYRYFQVNDISSMCSVSAQGKSAKEAIDELLYNHSYALESVSITAIPIYYLELNSRMYIHDERANISGDYIVTKMTLPLTYNGTMSLTATKAVDIII